MFIFNLHNPPQKFPLLHKGPPQNNICNFFVLIDEETLKIVVNISYQVGCKNLEECSI